MAAMILCLLLSFIATVFGGVVPSYSKVDSLDFEGYNAVDYSHFAHYQPSLPAYSTVSYVMSTGHSKPFTYSGFTNHGRGHHDPGYTVQFRTDGEKEHDSGHHYY